MGGRALEEATRQLMTALDEEFGPPIEGDDIDKARIRVLEVLSQMADGATEVQRRTATLEGDGGTGHGS